MSTWDYIQGLGIPTGAVMSRRSMTIGVPCPCGCGKALALACEHGGSMACPECLKKAMGQKWVEEEIHKGSLAAFTIGASQEVGK